MGMRLTVKGATVTVQDGSDCRTILTVGELALPAGSQTAVRGASGSGKSTFLKLISGIIRPSAGLVRWDSVTLSELSEAERDRFRGERIGFLCQDFRLFEGLTALENVLLPFTFRGAPSADDRARARALLKAHEVRAETPAERLSRGEMQRTALVRVLLQSPSVILADEPTASLDRRRAGLAVDALLDAAGSLGATLLLVTHDESLLTRFARTLTLSDGVLKEDA